ncbi:uncharacterized protein LOC122253941 [Penaeus japonicus]|uniref:uncharacterized protein LOC122253941 n=1 Tax=Penaeus japonicus TaxID=27405 RepID=UPI001C710F3B|nr:uncharacterized protein LOC122253941 [Penaeus japonicus]
MVTGILDLRCVRNTIHIHLMLTYLLLDTCWLLAATSQMFVTHGGGPLFCSLVLIFHFLHLANFSWMFMEGTSPCIHCNSYTKWILTYDMDTGNSPSNLEMESKKDIMGLYLYLSVVKTFSVEKIKLRLYLLLGWALPLPFVTTWAPLRVVFSSKKEVPRADLDSACPWLEDSPIDWVLRVPVLVILSVNTFFLIHVMVVSKAEYSTPQPMRLWLMCMAPVLVKKLRATTSLEAQPWLQQSKRALKSLCVLMPLLGSPHVLLLLAPARGTASAVVAYARAVVLSTQGLVVTVFYCFLNSEVQESINNHMERWKSMRDVPPGSCPYSANYQGSVTRNCVRAPVMVEKTTEVVPLQTFHDLTSSARERAEDLTGDEGMPVFPPAFPHAKKTRDSAKRNRRSPSRTHLENEGMNPRVQSSETSDSDSLPAVATAAFSSAQEARSRVIQQSSGRNTKDIIQPLKEVVAMVVKQVLANLAYPYAYPRVVKQVLANLAYPYAYTRVVKQVYPPDTILAK